MRNEIYIEKVQVKETNEALIFNCMDSEGGMVKHFFEDT